MPWPLMDSRKIACSGGRPTMVGRDGPYKSASKRPTRASPGAVAPNRLAKEKARLTATMDLPTPPLQEETAMMARTPARPAICLQLCKQGGKVKVSEVSIGSCKSRKAVKLEI